MTEKRSEKVFTRHVIDLCFFTDASHCRLVEDLSLFDSWRHEIFNAEDSTLADNGYSEGASMLLVSFVLLHHGLMSDGLRIVQSLLKFIELITLTL